MPRYSSRPCSCGSGKTHYPLLDAAGIFCTYVCEDCEKSKRAGYDPNIFKSGSYYAATGKEGDIGLEEDLRP